MNWLDIFFLAIVLFTLGQGLFKGLVKELASLAGLVLGILAANKYYGFWAQKLDALGVKDPYTAVCSYVTIVLLVLVAVILAGKLLRKLLKLGMLGWLDRLGGAILGILKGGLFVSVVLFILTWIFTPGSPVLNNSLFVPYITDFNRNLSSLLPRETRKTYMRKSRELQEVWQERFRANPGSKDSHK